MTTRKKIPIRIIQPELEEAPPESVVPVDEAPPPVAEAPPPAPSTPAAAPPPPTGPSEEEQALREEREQWKDRALRLEAEMDNFRKRLQRLAEERIAADRERLLRDFLEVADDLARALSVDATALPSPTQGESIRQGVELTHRSLMNLMNREGVTLIEADGQPFDPAWHEAVGTVPAHQVGKEPDTVVYVVRAGYRIGDRLLRPARVIVATAE